MLLLVAFAIVTLPLRLAFQARGLPYPHSHVHRMTRAAAPLVRSRRTSTTRARPRSGCGWSSTCATTCSGLPTSRSISAPVHDRTRLGPAASHTRTVPPLTPLYSRDSPGFFKKGVLVMHPRDIALNYLKVHCRAILRNSAQFCAILSDAVLPSTTSSSGSGSTWPPPSRSTASTSSHSSPTARTSCRASAARARAMSASRSAGSTGCSAR